MAVVEECCVLKDQCSSRVISVGHSTGADVAAGNTMRSGRQQKQQNLFRASTTPSTKVNIPRGFQVVNNIQYSVVVSCYSSSREGGTACQGATPMSQPEDVNIPMLNFVRHTPDLPEHHRVCGQA
jgi:hypothetical protein